GAGNLITDNNTYGVYFDGANTLATVTHNEITDNGSFPIRVLPLMCNVTNNICTGNSQDGIEVIGSNITKDVLWRTNNTPYIVTGSITVYKDATTPATLTIEAGVEIRFNGNLELTIGTSNLKGALIAQGTVDDPILFTSNAEMPAPGDWQGICFEAPTDDALTILEHCIIEYGGYSNRSNIMVNNSSPTIKNNTLRYSSYYGIRVIGEDSAPVIGGEAGAGNLITD
ncbi:MAG: hypothetical protein GY869_13520, partial [Planctomycetes bacterium]|nr:hypothetical protein [Planctomycetota bacterium]